MSNTSEQPIEIQIDEEMTSTLARDRKAELHLILENGAWRVEDADVGGGDSIPYGVFQEIELRYTLASVEAPARFNAAKIREFLEENQHHLDALAEGHGKRWDGVTYSYVGTLTAAAREAQLELVSAVMECEQRPEKFLDDDLALRDDLRERLSEEEDEEEMSFSP